MRAQMGKESRSVVKKYFYIVWRRQDNNISVEHEVIDCDPGDWLIENIGRPLGPIVIINQFEITADQFTRLESLQ